MNVLLIEERPGSCGPELDQRLCDQQLRRAASLDEADQLLSRAEAEAVILALDEASEPYRRWMQQRRCTRPMGLVIVIGAPDEALEDSGAGPGVRTLARDQLAELPRILDQWARDSASSEIETIQLGPATVPETEGAPLDADGQPRPPRLERYRILSVLGRGGMGVVYRAFDKELGRLIALKWIRPDIPGQSQLYKRFKAEAEITAQLQHPAIVPVYTLHRDDQGRLYYTMPIIRGHTLRELAAKLLSVPGFLRGESIDVDGQAWSLFRLLQAFVQITRAVGFAHERGVIHRDLKPANIMIGRYGDVRVMDWGLAKVVGDTPEALPDLDAVTLGGALETAPGSVLGTPAYLPPEAVEEGYVPAPAADIYALGGILYTLLTGSPPYTGSAREIIRRLGKRRPIKEPRELRPDIPPFLAEICMSALAHDPAERTPGAEALAEDLDGFLQGRSSRNVRPEDRAFVRRYEAAAYQRPSVTIDLVILAPDAEGRPALFLKRRLRPPFQDCWALPGSFVKIDEDFDDTITRLLARFRTDERPRARQVGTFGALHRDPRTRVITILYRVVLAARPELIDGEDGAWFAIADAQSEGPRLRDAAGAPLELAFDHPELIAAALSEAGAPAAKKKSDQGHRQSQGQGQDQA